ncbi:gfo/Idh/MocA family oxidoreductase [Opitutaceae bacterium TAV4]|uniref:Gfo/Idh/MocA family protein n=1 Tax=Geminisphaera colitermitum TaxID=1148786 RepID=UPI000158C52B|nr:Gfo/Idh/MocA family oxidoreductase [Geminisphaera colitermitum]RRJ95817.1 gfo/Idh/MocA family oxidoreductase [Opitutaceae bacterium TAV4]RRJ99188.1 gfo/Idh/MocA family oxidoreductase [Opitutaceae bacterium TAV3]
MKIAVIGTGNVATENYLPWFAAQTGIHLGCLDNNADRARAASGKFGGHSFATSAELIAWRPDAAFVLTNEMWHYDAGLPLIEAGLPRVLFEKPLVAAKGQAHVSEADFGQGKTLLQLAAKTGTEVAMLFNYRFFDQTITARRIVAERNFGKLVNLSGKIHYACWSHCIDLVHHFGGTTATITALEGATEHQGQGIVARDVVAAFTLENGATGTLIGTAGLKWQHPLFELILTFEGGRLHMRDIDGDLEILDGSTRIQERITTVRDASRWQHYTASFHKALTAYLDAVGTGKPAPVSGVDGLRELQFEAALRRSIAENRPVQIAREFPL